MGILSMFGLMTVEDYNRRTNDRIERYEGAIRSKDETIERLVGDRDGARRDASARATQIENLNDTIAKLAGEIAALKPDAEAMRAKRKRDVDLKAEKRAAKTALAPKPVAAKAKKGAGK